MKLDRCFRKNKHPLVLREKNNKEINEKVAILCRICTRVISEASFYACDVCEYYLHDSCSNLPDQINHINFHPSHPLKLDKEIFTGCNNCEQDFELLYTCSDECDFDMDVECALMPKISSSSEQGWIQHFSHTHSLSLVNPKFTSTILCNGCASNFSPDEDNNQVYSCNKCNFFLHKSCAEFPREIRRPLHLQHGFLSLRLGRENYDRKCSLCKCWQGGFFFKCCAYGCDFRLCWSCGKRERRSIKYEFHHHNLYFVEKTAHKELAKCSAYDGYCTQSIHTAHSRELRINKSSLFMCLDSEFKLHMLCGPLPATIKHERHIHNLVLVDWVVEDDYDGNYCDVCETERDIRIRCYYCQECKYYAHVHCLLPEIEKALIDPDELKDHTLKVKILGQDIWNYPSDQLSYKNDMLDFTFKDVINKLTRSEKNTLESFFQWDDEISSNKGDIPTNISINRNSEPMLSTEDIDETLTLVRFTDSHFRTLFDQFYEYCQYNKLVIKSSDLELKNVNVEGYTVPYTVGRVMRALLHTYGDISNDYSSREWNSIVYFFICETLRRMSTTLVIDITKADLREWYYHLIFARVQYFNVDFACAQLERLVRAFLGIRADKLKDEIPSIIDRNIAILEEKIQKLQQEIADEKAKKEISKRYSGSSPKAQFMVDCLKEGSNMKWKKAFGHNLIQSRSSSKPILSSDYWY